LKGMCTCISSTFRNARGGGVFLDDHIRSCPFVLS
jgi:hypothetical protein